MAIVSVNRPMQQQQARTPEPSFVDKSMERLLKGLQIASTGYGIKVNMDRAAALQAQTEQTRAQTAAMPTPEESQAQRQAELGFTQERGRTQKAETRRTEAQIKLDEQRFRADQDQAAFERVRKLGEDEQKLQQKFRTDTRTKRILESYDASKSIETLLADENVSPLTVSAAMVRAIRASGEVGAITQSDLERFTGDPSLAARAQRIIDRTVKGEVPQFDVEAFRNLAQALKQFNIESLDKHASAIARTEGRRFGDPQFVKNEILVPQAFVEESNQQQQAGAEFSDAEIQAVMDATGGSRADAILRLKSVSGGQ